MDLTNELLDAIEIIVRQVVEENTAKIYTGVCKSVYTGSCKMTINGKDNTVKSYGGTPVVGETYRVFVPSGNMSMAFIIVPGAGSSSSDTPATTSYNNLIDLPSINDVDLKGNKTSKDLKLYGPDNPPSYPVQSVNGKTGVVELEASDVNALPNTTTIPTKTSQLTNDSNFITSADTPVSSVNGKTGAVQLTASDVGALPSTTPIPTVNDATLTIKRNNTSVGTFTANSSTDKSINITVPTSKSDIGLGNVDNVKQYSESNPPPYPVTSVNGKTGTVQLTADDVSAVPTSGGTMTGNLTVGSSKVQSNGYIIGAWLQTTADTHLNTTSSKVAVLDTSGWVYHRTLDEFKTDLDIPTTTSALTNDSGYITGIPTASATTLGGIKIGAGLSINSQGILSATVGGTADAVDWENVLGTPTTLAGYGITDVKIENGVITLGNSTITPQLKGNYAVTDDSNTFEGEQKMLNSTYCPTMNDIANGVGCSLKNSRACDNQLIVAEIYAPSTAATDDDINMQSVPGEITFYKIDGQTGGKTLAKTELAKINTDGVTANIGNFGGAKIALGDSVDIIGTTKQATTISNQLVLQGGAVFSGTASNAGLVTRGICGVTTPDANGACSKSNLFVNFDGSSSGNVYQSNRQLVLQAGSVGTHYGNNLYQYAAARGDAVKGWVESQGYSKIEVNSTQPTGQATGDFWYEVTS